MTDADKERALREQRDRDLAELYPTAEAWERSYPPTLPPQDPDLRQQYDDFKEMAQTAAKEKKPDVIPERAAVNKALNQAQVSDEISAAEQEKRERDSHTHGRMMRGSAEAARDALHDCGPGKEPGAYTVSEARDRAAHTPPAHKMEPER